MHGYYRVTRNAMQHDGTGNASSERWNRLGLNIAPWQKGGRHILVCPPSQKFGELLGFNAAAWLQTTLNTLKRHTDREIRVRAKKGNATPLDADLKDCHALVAHSSNAAVLALLAGVPVFCTAPCAAYRMGGADMSKIEMPVYPDDREQWAWNLADHQWTLEEMRHGLCWRMLQEEIECRDLNKTEPAGKGWYQIPGVQAGDRTLSEQLIGLEPLFELAPGKTILDLGCAEGLISLELMKAGAVLTHGVEAVGSRVDHAREHFHGRDAAFYHADLNDFAHAPPVGLLESYDIVLLLSIIHKMQDTAAFVRAAAARSKDIVAIRLPDAVIRDKRSNFVPLDVPALMAELGFHAVSFRQGTAARMGVAVPAMRYVPLYREMHEQRAVHEQCACAMGGGYRSTGQKERCQNPAGLRQWQRKSIPHRKAA